MLVLRRFKQFFQLNHNAMNRFFLTAFAVCAVVGAANAQISGGIKAGLNFANQDYEEGSFSVSPDGRTGFHAGAYLSIMFSDNVGLQPELLYSAQGSEFDFAGTETIQKFNYINVPILLKYQVVDILSLHAGPQIGFLASAETETDGNDEDISDNIKGSDFSLAFGGQVDLPMGLIGGIRYSLGLSDVNDLDGDDTEVSNNNFQVYVGFKLFGE